MPSDAAFGLVRGTVLVLLTGAMMLGYKIYHNFLEKNCGNGVHPLAHSDKVHTDSRVSCQIIVLYTSDTSFVLPWDQ